MNKKIVRVMVFYEDGTFSEIAADLSPKFDLHKPIPRTPTPFVPVDTTKWYPKACMRCGETRTGSCGKLECPNGHINPWDNSPKVTD